MDEFIFFLEKSNLNADQNAKSILVKKKVEQKKELFNLYYIGLNFPSYFGNNWDALNDCLTDLSWIKKRRVVIIHEDIPFKSFPIEQKKYIQLLYDVKNNWKNNKIHTLEICFPEDSKKEIEKLLEK